jgi:hypothetical protein
MYKIVMKSAKVQYIVFTVLKIGKKCNIGGRYIE